MFVLAFYSLVFCERILCDKPISSQVIRLG